MLGAVTDVSYGILSIQPKFADGTPIENIEDAIITSNGAEVKAWVSIAQYLESLEDTNGDGISDVPDYYTGTQGRKIVESSHALSDLLKNPNKYAIIIILAVIVATLLIIAVICLMIKLIRKLMRKRRK